MPSLFDTVPDDLDEYEKAVALYLDPSRFFGGVETWLTRPLFDSGYERPRIYADFVVQEGKHKNPRHYS